MDFSSLFANIRNSECPLSLLKSYVSDGVVLKDFNNCEEIGSLVCFLVSKTYGLGLKILFDCGLDMSASHHVTGDTPLIILCSEGLCGATKQLIDKLGPASLFHSNIIGLTAITQLLCRAHGACSCLESLLSRLYLCSVLLPNDLKTNNYAYTLGSSGLPYSEGLLRKDEGNQVLFTVEELLDRIKSDDIERIISVLQLWIKANLLRMAHTTEDTTVRNTQLTRNTNVLEERLIKPSLSYVSCSKNSVSVMSKLGILLFQLIILGQLHRCLLIDRIIQSGPGDSENQNLANILENIRRHLEAPLNLRLLVIREIRRTLQYRFIFICQLNDKYNPIISENALSMVTWINQLPLPSIIKQHVLLSPMILKFS
ncbi:hypothetical protein EWB00_009538 [Schistosoma japonicum]|uniref:Uncharacterized protein n=2 Tax=Schistosoma japonicum TaxID=6182 RepID=A0A4Z2DS43_SCHJA|nr:hypothetical protein KSF78_0000728 [Schistosoma japonicum]TNN19000.1 hypothetical protein EWB00_009538 [Schistosoma japonicum]